MTKKLLFSLGLLVSVAMAEAASRVDSVKYRRSSLYTIMMPDIRLEGDALEVVKTTYQTSLLPDKYNSHNLQERFINPSEIYVDADERAVAKGLLPKEGAVKKAFGFVGGLLKSTAKEIGQNLTGMQTSSEENKLTDDEALAKILKYFKQNRIAHRAIAKWYGAEEDNQRFNYDLIAERGLYNASAQELELAKKTKMGQNRIIDGAALELIPNTYVLVSLYSYLSAEQLAADVSAVAATAGAMLAGGDGAQLLSGATSLIGSAFKGYFVVTRSYLFQLEWDKAQQEEFEKKYYGKSLKEFLSAAPAGAYRFKFVGKIKDHAPATIKLRLSSGNDEALITRATVRATDGAIAKLSKKYPAFRPKVAVQVEDGVITAKIGRKEGLSGGEEFAVYEQVQQEDGSIKYDKVTTIKVIKGKVWDNRYGAEVKIDGGDQEDNGGSESSKLGKTYFKGKADKILSGMIIQQVK